MNFSPLVTIVPALPPVVNGLGDYSFLMADALEKNHGVLSFFLNTDQTSGKYDTVHALLERNDSSLLSKLGTQQVVILHYVGYAYNEHGLPFWLVKGLRKWKQINPGAKLITVFHEVYANGYPWKREFWTSPLQRRIAKNLLKLSDFSIANTEITREILKDWSPSSEIKYLPVFSNIGELETNPLFSEREDKLVLFGSPAVRSRLYQERKYLEAIIKNFGIEGIIEIGASESSGFPSLNDIPVQRKGILTAPEISSILKRCKFGIIHYPQHLLAKSGIFAAYSAHGMVPLVIGKQIRSEADLKPGVHYLPATNGDMDKISANVFQWYQEHSTRNSARIIFNKLQEFEIEKGV